MRTAPVAVVLAVVLPASVRAQASGEFVIPAFRGAAPAEFAYWDRFDGSFGVSNYLVDNPPALGGGEDFAFNPTTMAVDEASLVQTGTETAFVTSSGAIYSFAEPTSFELRVTPDLGGAPIANVVFQLQTGGVRLEPDDVRLVAATDGGGEPGEVELAADFKALDDPQTGGFSERLMTGFQWDLSGLGVTGPFVIRFASPDSSMPVWACQLDVVPGGSFEQALGYLLEARSLPAVRFGAPGRLLADLPFSAETRFFLSGESFPVFGEPEDGFVPAGFVAPDVTVVEGDELIVTFGAADLEAAAVFAPVDYETWRNHFFFHANTLTMQGPDNEDDAVSGRDADPDGDGLRNFAEYAFACDPYTPDAARAVPVASVVEIDGQAHAALTFRRWATDPLDADIEHVVAASNDGATWIETGVVVEHGSELRADGSRLVTMRSVEPIGAAAESPLLLRVVTREVAP